MNAGPSHQMLREMIGAFALGHLGGAEAQQLQAHLDGCAECRQDLREIEPIARRLDAIDREHFESPPMPPGDLGERIGAEVARERADHENDEVARRRARTAYAGVRRARLLGVAAAVVVVALGLGGLVGGLVGRATAPQASVVPTEPISMKTPGSAGVTVESADLVAHTWGVELRIVGAGFADGQTFRASFRTEDGQLTPAGEFRGVGEASMTCFLQSAALRDDVTAVVITDEQGRTVLTSSL